MCHFSITQKMGILAFLFLGISLCIPSLSTAYEVSGFNFDDLHLKGCPPGSRGGYVPRAAPSGPSPDEVRRQKEEQDLREAADDANDKGVEFAKKGEWDTALRYLKEALEYTPDDDLIKNNLAKVQEYKLRANAAKNVPTNETIKGMGGPTTPAVTNPQIAKLMRDIGAIKVPSPISSDQFSVQLRPEDKKSKRILLGTDIGVAVADLTALRLAGEGFTLAPTLVLATGKTFIDMEDAADVYLVKKGEVYEQALRWLKDKKTAPQFSDVVRALKENKPLPAGTSEEMVGAAKAILDPKLGNSGMRIAWGAMWSPQAKAALVKSACIELGSGLMGKGVEGVTKTFLAQRKPAFGEALEKIETAEALMNKYPKNSLEREKLKNVIREASRVMGLSYQVVAAGTGLAVPLIAEEGLEKINKMK